MPTTDAIPGIRVIARRLLLLALVPLVLSACGTAPAARDDYEQLYRDRCSGYGMNRPPYCDR